MRNKSILFLPFFYQNIYGITEIAVDIDDIFTDTYANHVPYAL